MTVSRGEGEARLRRPVSSPVERVAWIDGIKAIGLLWIALVHWSQQVFGDPQFGNPGLDWPPLAERIAQLAPLEGHGVWDGPLSALRLIGWMGDAGVQLFLIASGFGLAYGLALARRRGKTPRWGDFYRRRLGRLYPLWWLAHIGVLAIGLVLQRGVSPASDLFWMSWFGLRFTPETIYLYSPSWWFMGLILQLYAIYPLLDAALARLGPRRFALVFVSGALVVRAVGLWAFAGPLADWNYLDTWSRGAIFVSRLAEFALGMALAALIAARRGAVEDELDRVTTLLAGAGLMAAGFVLSFFLFGNAVSPLLMGAGALIVARRLLVAPLEATRLGAGALEWIARHSLSLFLTHQLAIQAFVPAGTPIGPGLWLRTAAALAVAVAAALALEGVAAAIARGWRALTARVGDGRAAVAVAAVAGALYALLLAGELYSRRVAPQEIAGWGERPSLRPDARFGWTLIPDRTTRLRWTSYDYVVEANALGFPGPLYPEAKPEGALRVMVTGDAFTSAEGVDTGEAWPRLLARDLETLLPGRPIEVMNFAVTGYGPANYAAVLNEMAPRFRPDVVLVAMFVNDFEDARTTMRAFQRSIGFGQPDPNGLFATLTLGNLYETAAQAIRKTVYERALGRPSPQTRFFGMLDAFSTDPEIPDAETLLAVERRMIALQMLRDGLGSRLVVLLVPAPVQVCAAAELPWAPRGLDLGNAERFDLDKPQRNLGDMLDSLDIERFDLRPVLKAAPGGCPYQPHNLHWRESGHAAVAAAVARLIADGAEPAPER